MKEWGTLWAELASVECRSGTALEPMAAEEEAATAARRKVPRLEHVQRGRRADARPQRAWFVEGPKPGRFHTRIRLRNTGSA